MDMLIKICAIAIVSVIAALILRKNAPELSLTLTIAAGILIFMTASGALKTTVSFVRTLATMAGIAPAVLAPLLKTVGIAILTKIAADVCRDAGIGSLASYVELAGGVIATVISLPLLMSVIKLVSSI
ncbi:MAG: SpoIIIAC/SpoIIIAD family protein [Clostridia bacterium]